MESKTVSLSGGKGLQWYEDLKGRAPQSVSGLLNPSSVQQILTGAPFPTSRDEAYRYGRVERFYGKQYRLAGEGDLFLQTFSPETLFQCEVPRLEAETVYLLNGCYYALGGKPLHRASNGVVWGSLRAAVLEEPELVMRSVEASAHAHEGAAEAFPRMAEALGNDGFFLYVPDGIELSRPVQVISLVEGKGEHPFLLNTRHVVHVGARARVSLLLCGHSFIGNGSLDNSAMSIGVGAGAHVEVVSLESHHADTGRMSAYRVHAASDSEYSHSFVTLDGGYVRSDVEVHLTGERAHCSLWGVLLSDREQYSELQTRIEHSAPNGTSQQLVKGLADDRAEISFYGLINVCPDAQGTKAYQRNANMVLNDAARVHTRPQLLIHADDVQCSHGATVGQIDDLARFYMLQRGISPEEANRLLMYAFVSDALAGITQEPLRQRLEQLVGNRIAGKRPSCYGVGCGVVGQ